MSSANGRPCFGIGAEGCRSLALLRRCSSVKVPRGYSPSSRGSTELAEVLAAAPNLWQPTRFLSMRWVLSETRRRKRSRLFSKVEIHRMKTKHRICTRRSSVKTERRKRAPCFQGFETAAQQGGPACGKKAWWRRVGMEAEESPQLIVAQRVANTFRERLTLLLGRSRLHSDYTEAFGQKLNCSF
jgi:hypothetical protein